MRVPRLCVVEREEVRLHVSPFVNVIVGCVNGEVRVAVVKTNGAPTVQGLGRVFQDRAMLRDGDEGRVRMVHYGQEIFLLYVSSGVPICVNVFRP